MDSIWVRLYHVLALLTPFASWSDRHVIEDA